ncbi:MAG: hypothetical protein IT327_07800 [Anaerolineae bacterium]|nr:hypothetical protein [Anaerolineae bacterium]
MANERKLIGSPFQRGVNETRPYRIDVSVWGAGTYASPAVTILDETGADVTADVLSGSASFSGSYLTTPDFVANGLTAGRTYIMIISWTVNGKTVSAFGQIEAQQ